MKDSNTYDICIIGAGIAGLYVAVEMLRRKKGVKICIIEKYKFLGGRAMTFKGDVSGTQYQWEEGSARISERHTLMMGLLRRYKMGLIRIEGESKYKDSGLKDFETNVFDKSIPITIAPLEGLEKKTLQTSTLEGLFKKYMSPQEVSELCIRYPYRAEIETLQADLAIQVFQNEFSPKEKYVLCKEGLSEFIGRIESDIKARGGNILSQHECIEMSGANTLVCKKGRHSEGGSRPNVEIRADHFVFALPSEALKKIPQFKDLPLLKRIVMKPLLRVYAAFPPGSNGRVWFDGMGKVITAEAPRYIIPVSTENGSIQISYTDSQDAETLMKILEKSGEDGLGKKLVEDLRLLFQGVYTIPDPLFVKAYSWKDGVSYWLPGEYDPYEESREAVCPLKEHRNWFVCGESYSTRQCWMEGAIEHAEMVVNRLAV